MATARVMAIANTTTTSCLLSKTAHFLPKKGLFGNSLCLTRRVASTKRSFTCIAIYNPHVQIKEQGQPETLDYRVFLEDYSGKKVKSFPFVIEFLVYGVLVGFADKI